MILKHSKKGKNTSFLLTQVNPETLYRNANSVISNITKGIEENNPKTKLTQPMWTVGKK